MSLSSLNLAIYQFTQKFANHSRIESRVFIERSENSCALVTLYSP